MANPEMIKMVRNAHKQYDDDRERQNAFQSEGQKQLPAKRKASNDLTKAVWRGEEDDRGDEKENDGDQFKI